MPSGSSRKRKKPTPGGITAQARSAAMRGCGLTISCYPLRSRRHACAASSTTCRVAGRSPPIMRRSLPTLKSRACTHKLHEDDHWHLLDNDEKAKANRFHFNIHRHRFIAARGILRCLAGQLLGQPPNALQFSYTSYGKPILKEYPRLQFNLSHSHDRAIYAFTLDMAIGVDIEYQNSQCDVESIAKRFFTAREFNALQTLPGPEKIATFFKLWVRKEAVLKALGYGLSWPL